MLTEEGDVLRPRWMAGVLTERTRFSPPLERSYEPPESSSSVRRLAMN